MNTLSRSLSKENSIPKEEILRRLDGIDKIEGYGFLWILVAYFFGAFGFAMALGVPLLDSATSGLAGLCLGVVSYYLSRFVSTGYIMTILGSCVITFSVNVMFHFGIGEYPSRMMLGALMLLVPGAFFTNSVRELSNRNVFVTYGDAYLCLHVRRRCGYGGSFALCYANGRSPRNKLLRNIV